MSIDVIAIGTDIVINREQFRFAYIRPNEENSTFSVVLVFDGDPAGGLAFTHPDAAEVATLDEAREVLHQFHTALLPTKRGI